VVSLGTIRTRQCDIDKLMRKLEGFNVMDPPLQHGFYEPE
jgi:hypothetical protein